MQHKSSQIDEYKLITMHPAASLTRKEFSDSNISFISCYNEEYRDDSLVY